MVSARLFAILNKFERRRRVTLASLAFRLFLRFSQNQTRRSITSQHKQHHSDNNSESVVPYERNRFLSITHRQISDPEISNAPRQRDCRRKTHQRHFKYSRRKYKYLERCWRR